MFTTSARATQRRVRLFLQPRILPSSGSRQSGLGAIHYLEKPFPRADFITLVEALLAPADEESARFQGTLSDLHVSDIIQLKCISGATSMLEFTGPARPKGPGLF